MSPEVDKPLTLPWLGVGEMGGTGNGRSLLQSERGMAPGSATIAWQFTGQVDDSNDNGDDDSDDERLPQWLLIGHYMSG